MFGFFGLCVNCFSGHAGFFSELRFCCCFLLRVLFLFLSYMIKLAPFWHYNFFNFILVITSTSYEFIYLFKYILIFQNKPLYFYIIIQYFCCIVVILFFDHSLIVFNFKNYIFYIQIVMHKKLFKLFFYNWILSLIILESISKYFHV